MIQQEEQQQLKEHARLNFFEVTRILLDLVHGQQHVSAIFSLER